MIQNASPKSGYWAVRDDDVLERSAGGKRVSRVGKRFKRILTFHGTIPTIPVANCEPSTESRTRIRSYLNSTVQIILPFLVKELEQN